MKRNVIRYQTKPEKTAENLALIEAVFAELRQKAPAGARYLVLKLADGSFIHFVTVETADGSNPIPQLTAFRAFQAAIKDRVIEPPQTLEATVVGDYRVLGSG
jgi:hypothetical protein